MAKNYQHYFWFTTEGLSETNRADDVDVIDCKKKRFGVPPSGGRFRCPNLPPEGGTPNPTTFFSKRQAIIIVWFLAAVFCGNAIAQTQKSDDALRVLFIGNSLTYTNDLPAIVAALAEANKQQRFVYKSIAFPDFSLEDHWQQGEARKAIAKEKWDFVVMQQGPSALPESRKLLLEYVRRFAAEIRRSGAQPAFFMVWPSAARFNDFDRVSESYRLAAEEVKGALFPVGEAWRAAWRGDANLKLYSPDGLHPSQIGSYTAALVIYEQLYKQSPVGLPSRLQIRSKTISKIEIPTAQAALLQQAAAEANTKFMKK